ncbi:hypothetical protein [Dapis sp. BLCC M229]|uniref:hypothetical protein n=1 Tax=Dapis sp. BLCC M229 TaxID=3400188 RepID=UPI003CEEF655
MDDCDIYPTYLYQYFIDYRQIILCPDRFQELSKRWLKTRALHPPQPPFERGGATQLENQSILRVYT